MEPVVVYLYAPHLLADVQQHREPALRGLPLAIVHEGHLVDLSWEAEALGLDTGCSLHQARMACPQLQVRPYGAAQVREWLEGWWKALADGSAAVEPDGLRGVFVERAVEPAGDMTEARALRQAREALQEAGRQLLRRTLQVLPARAVAGVGPNKLAAKAAALLQARRGRTGPPSRAGTPQGSLAVAWPVQAFLAPLPLQFLWTLPEPWRRQLSLLGVRTVGELAAMGPEALCGRFGPQGWRVWAWSRGMDASPVVPLYPPPAIVRSLDLTSPEAPPLEEGGYLAALVREWAMGMAEELRQSRRWANRWGMRLLLHHPAAAGEQELAVERTACPGERQHRPAAMADMAQRLLYRVVEQARPWEEGGALPIRLQLAAFQLRPALPRQAGMFAQPGPGDDQRLRRALEAVRHRVGPGYLRLAGELGLSWREARLALLEQGAWLP